MKRSKRKKKLRSVAGFVLAFSLSIIMLTGLCFALWKSDIAIKGGTRPGNNEMINAPRGNLLVVIKGDANEGGPGGKAFLLLGFDKEDCYINVMVLPGDLLAPTNALTDVLSGQYLYGGALYCKQAVEFTYGIRVHRVAEVSLSAVGEIADSFGGMSYDLPYDLVYETGSGISIEYKAGRQTVNGGVLVKILEGILETEERQERYERLGDFFVQAINEFGQKVLTKDGSFKLLTSFIIADITYRDFAVNKKAFGAVLSKTGQGLARPVVLKGERKEEGDFFTVTSQGQEQLERYFGEEASGE